MIISKKYSCALISQQGLSGLRTWLYVNSTKKWRTLVLNDTFESSRSRFGWRILLIKRTTDTKNNEWYPLFERFLNNSAQRHGFRVNELFVKMIIRCDTPPPKGKFFTSIVMNDRLIRACTEPNRDEVIKLAWLAITFFWLLKWDSRRNVTEIFNSFDATRCEIQLSRMKFRKMTRGLMKQRLRRN